MLTSMETDRSDCDANTDYTKSGILTCDIQHCRSLSMKEWYPVALYWFTLSQPEIAAETLRIVGNSFKVKHTWSYFSNKRLQPVELKGRIFQLVKHICLSICKAPVTQTVIKSQYPIYFLLKAFATYNHQFHLW